MYKHALLGGTFDHFHIGHQALITTALQQAGRLSIGITHASLHQQKHLVTSIEPFTTRKQSVEKYLEKSGFLQKTTLIPIHDIYGTSLSDKSLDALFATEITKPNAFIINNERQNTGLSPLHIITIPIVKNEHGEIISSEAIRKGEMDRLGNSYYNFFTQKKLYTLPDKLRDSLHKPVGEITTDIKYIQALQQTAPMLITVGDITTASLLKEHVSPSIMIVDLKTRRQDLSHEIISQYNLTKSPVFTNQPGTINSTFGPIFKKTVTNNMLSGHSETLVVNGEEDLLALPVILLAPLNTLLIYGQYNEGMVLVRITEEKKAYAKTLLNQFKKQ